MRFPGNGVVERGLPKFHRQDEARSGIGDGDSGSRYDSSRAILYRARYGSHGYLRGQTQVKQREHPSNPHTPSFSESL
jgi:hypothetical protein